MQMKLVASLGTMALACALGGCATYHEDLMSAQELQYASCSALITEEQKVNDNIAAWDEAASIGLAGLAGMTALETQAGTDGSGVYAMGDTVAQSGNEMQQLRNTRAYIQRLRMNKGC